MSYRRTCFTGKHVLLENMSYWSMLYRKTSLMGVHAILLKMPYGSTCLMGVHHIENVLWPEYVL